jgi:hypothetical protein
MSKSGGLSNIKRNVRVARVERFFSALVSDGANRRYGVLPIGDMVHGDIATAGATITDVNSTTFPAVVKRSPWRI